MSSDNNIISSFERGGVAGPASASNQNKNHGKTILKSNIDRVGNARESEGSAYWERVQ